MKKCALLLILVLMTGMLSSCAVSETDGGEAAQLVCLNIGKADCMLLLYQSEAYLIDTGYEQNWPALETMLRQYGVTRLNGVFVTHCHEDHEGGLMALAKSDTAVDAWYAPRIYYGISEALHPAVQAAAVRNASVSWLEAGNRLTVGSDGSFSVLGPLSVNVTNENNNSLVMRFSCGQGSILFTGDMKEDEEYELLQAGAFSSCDVLKVGHHGDNKATGKKMLKIVQPDVAVILTDSREEPDTPASSTLKRLDNVDCVSYISQDFSDALLITLKKGQKPTVTDVAWDDVPQRAENVSLSIDTENDTLTVYNRGNEALNLNGCSVYSTKGNELFTLPDATVAAGGQIVIGTKSTGGGADVYLPAKKVWNKKNLDRAIFYDAYGRVLACTDNGLAE
jgi:competence protein ComEC